MRTETKVHSTLNFKMIRGLRNHNILSETKTTLKGKITNSAKILMTGHKSIEIFLRRMKLWCIHQPINKISIKINSNLIIKIEIIIVIDCWSHWLSQIKISNKSLPIKWKNCRIWMILPDII